MIFTVSLYISADAQIMKNSGAAINVFTGSFLYVKDASLKDSSGAFIKTQGDAQLRVTDNFISDGSKTRLKDNSKITVEKDLWNNDNLLNMDNSFIWVKGKIINWGFILNEKYIVIGP